jgi:hypothetical protein
MLQRFMSPELGPNEGDTVTVRLGATRKGCV